MNEQDFLIKKYEYDTVYKLELEARLREENNKYQEAKTRMLKKNSDFEKVRNDFIERKNIDSESMQNNLKFLQKRIVDKSKDLEKNQKIAKELEKNTDALMTKLNRSKKSLEFIYKKIEDIKLTQKIRKENLESSENIETFMVNKRFKDLFESENAKTNLDKLGDDKDKESNLTLDTDVKLTDDVQNNANSNNDLTVDTSLPNQDSRSQTQSEMFASFTENQNDSGTKDHFLSFEKFKERIDSLNVQNFTDGSSISLNYTSESGNEFHLNFVENQKVVDINIDINSYKDYLNFNKEKAKILETLKDKGINVRNIILRQKV